MYHFIFYSILIKLAYNHYSFDVQRIINLLLLLHYSLSLKDSHNSTAAVKIWRKLTKRFVRILRFKMVLSKLIQKCFEQVNSINVNDWIW